jgi:hypothetical protein
MRKLSEYKARAEECRKMAAAIKNAEQKRQLQQMAETWEMLAREREAQIRMDANWGGLSEATWASGCALWSASPLKLNPESQSLTPNDLAMTVDLTSFREHQHETIRQLVIALQRETRPAVRNIG